MTIFLSSITAIVVVEVLIRMSIVSRGRSLVKRINTASLVLRSNRISDTWKERALLRYALDIVTMSGMLATILILIVALIGMLDAFLRILIRVDLLERIISPIGLATATLAAFVYLVLRKRLFRD
ncbi:MAG: hypothetical protein AAGA12_14550 [Pseudomonadota bacterium]